MTSTQLIISQRYWDRFICSNTNEDIKLSSKTPFLFQLSPEEYSALKRFGACYIPGQTLKYLFALIGQTIGKQINIGSEKVDHVTYWEERHTVEILFKEPLSLSFQQKEEVIRTTDSLFALLKRNKGKDVSFPQEVSLILKFSELAPDKVKGEERADWILKRGCSKHGIEALEISATSYLLSEEEMTLKLSPDSGKNIELRALKKEVGIAVARDLERLGF